MTAEETSSFAGCLTSEKSSTQVSVLVGHSYEAHSLGHGSDAEDPDPVRHFEWRGTRLQQTDWTPLLIERGLRFLVATVASPRQTQSVARDLMLAAPTSLCSGKAQDSHRTPSPRRGLLQVDRAAVRRSRMLLYQVLLIFLISRLWVSTKQWTN